MILRNSIVSRVKSLEARIHFRAARKIISSCRIIAIAGCGHSGTSIMHRLLGYHIDILQIPAETYWFSGKSLSTKSMAEIASIATAKELFKAKFILEKTPSSVNNLELIKKVFPMSKVVVMTRNPLDVAASLKARGISIDASVDRWVLAAKVLLRNLDKDYVIHVKLEELVSDPRGVLENLQANLGLRPIDLLEYHGRQPKLFYSDSLEKPNDALNGDNHNQFRNWQINQRLFTSTSRWKKELSRGEVEYVKKHTSQFVDLLN